MKSVRSTGVLVFLVLLGTYAFYWQGRDWNTASRLMLTYALADRGTVCIDGLEDQTRDRARIGPHYYSDKFPGASILAIPPYLAAKFAFGLPPHPRNERGFSHWWPDYWATLGTSGLATALTALLLLKIASDLGCSPWNSALIGLSYGLATPAFPYATLLVGHQQSAAALMGSLVLIRASEGSKRRGILTFSAGFLASLAVAIELPMAPVAAVLGLAIISRAIRRAAPPSSIVAFGVGGLIPIVGVLAYNMAAFGSPLDMGYFHEDLAIFGDVHNADNPLGLTGPNWSRASALLWGRHRGLLFYAPVLALAIPGWWMMFRRKHRELAIVSISACLIVFVVNLSYPNWTGGWSTGPRLLVPLLPFAMIAVAAALAGGGRIAGILTFGATIGGGILMFLFVGVGARVPDGVPDPLRQAVLPLWTGAPIPRWWTGDRFASTLVSRSFPDWVRSPRAGRAWLGFAPLLAFQAIGIASVATSIRRSRSGRGGVEGAPPGR